MFLKLFLNNNKDFWIISNLYFLATGSIRNRIMSFFLHFVTFLKKILKIISGMPIRKIFKLYRFQVFQIEFTIYNNFHNYSNFKSSIICWWIYISIFVWWGTRARKIKTEWYVNIHISWNISFKIWKLGFWDRQIFWYRLSRQRCKWCIYAM